MTTEEQARELRPCPFCGGEANGEGHIRYSRPLADTWWEDGSEITEAFFVNCIKCGISNGSHGLVGGYQTRAEAVARWNTRTPTERAQTGAVVLRAPEVDKVLDDLRQAIEEGAGDLAVESERIIRLMRAEHRRLWQLANFPSGERAQIVSWLEGITLSREWDTVFRWAAEQIKAGKHLSEPTSPPTGEVE